jgi:PAS domain S-box-containing protein
MKTTTARSIPSEVARFNRRAMRKNYRQKGYLGGLRKKAEERLVNSATDTSKLSPDQIQALTQELEVHQIELQLQNIELQEAQSKLQEARDDFAALFDLAPIGYLMVSSPRGIIRKANLAAAELLGVDRKTLVGQRITHYVSRESGDAFYFHQKKAIESKTKQVDRVEMLKANGQRFNARLETTADSKGQLRLAIIDITELVKAQNSLRTRLAELEIANKNLESFTFSISNNLKAPVRRLDALSEAVLEDCAGKLGSLDNQYLQFIRSSSKLLTNLIDDLLALSGVILVPMDYSRVDLSALAEQSISELKMAEPNRPAEIKIRPGMIVLGDRHLLKVLLDNLLGNAFKFTSKNPFPLIEMGVLITPGQAPRFFVRDNGVGFDVSHATDLFRPFRRFHPENEFPGAGIGLALVQRIINRHHGKVWARSEPGKGATLYFTLNDSEQPVGLL